jgi:hypothetical protein
MGTLLTSGVIPPFSNEPTPVVYDTAWLLWSTERQMWWGPDRAGYTASIAHAGVYTEEEAQRLAGHGVIARPLAHVAQDGVAPMRRNTVVWLMSVRGRGV